MKGPVLLLGATSEIGRAIGRSFARKGVPLILAGRDREELERNAADLRIRNGVNASVELFDAVRPETHAVFFEHVSSSEPSMQGVVICFGLLGENERALEEPSHAFEVIQVNYTGAISALLHASRLLRKKKGAFLAAVSSVAGDRGRGSNFVYGSAKAGLSTFLDGLRNRLYREGVHVVTIKPGFVDTQMIFGKAEVKGAASPGWVGERIVRAIERRKNVVYIPWFWRPILLAVKGIPEPIFKRMKL